MSNRIVIAAFLLGAVAVAMVVRDMRDPLEAPPFPALLTKQTSAVVQGDGRKPVSTEAQAAESQPEDLRGAVAANSRSATQPADTPAPVAPKDAEPSQTAANVASNQDRAISPAANNAATPTSADVGAVAVAVNRQPAPKTRTPARSPETSNTPIAKSPPKASPITPRLSQSLRRAEADEGAELKPPQAIAQAETPVNAPDQVADAEAASEARFRRLISFLNKRDSARAVGENKHPSGDERFADRPPNPYGAGRVEARQASSQSAAALVFAGGAVELRAPWDWRAYEVSAGREVRLAITPGEIRSHDDALEGLWVACHVQAQGDPSRPDIAALMKKRLSSLLKNADIRPIEATPLAGKVAYRASFSVAGASGFHILIPMQWGVCEVHARTENRAALSELNKIITNLIVRDINTSKPALDERVAASSQILGVWKAFRSKLRLMGDGRIEIEPETKSVRQLGEAEQESVKVLRGDFEARDDLLFVRWDDGSFLNFRWRLDGDSLLLTDHEGRVSELRMLLE